MEPTTTLVVDDDPGMLDMLTRYLEQQGYEVARAPSGADALSAIEGCTFDVALVDLRLPDTDGMQVVRRITAECPTTIVIVMTGFGSIQSAVEAMRSGAEDYLTKPFHLSQLDLVLSRAQEKRSLREENTKLRRMLLDKQSFGELLGRSRKMLQVYEVIEHVAPTDTTVLIEGESGTGKELVAREIHRRSGRSSAKLLSVNCGALQETLLASELFGHEEGAFTGAVRRKAGLLEAAHGGSFFLDEVAEMSPGLQVRMLRVLEERQVVPVGGTAAVDVDVRLIAATNKTLADEVEAGRFRRDLFYRLNVVRINLPPLRERADDIPVLTGRFLARYTSELQRPTPHITDEAMDILCGGDWPGNVRHLENVIERAVALDTDGVLTPEDLPMEVLESASQPGSSRDIVGKPLRDVLRQTESQYIHELLKSVRGNVSEAARRARVSRPNLHKRIRDLEIDVSETRR